MLTIGSLTLTPAFDSEVYEYTATTSNTTNAITAATDDENAVITITVNGEPHTNGASATWDTGANVVVVTVLDGTVSQDYTVTVTKTED